MAVEPSDDIEKKIHTHTHTIRTKKKNSNYQFKLYRLTYIHRVARRKISQKYTT